MTMAGETRREPPRGGGIAFLLAQIGAQAATQFAERVAALDLTPPQTGLLRAITRQAGESQQWFAKRLGVPPSRFVQLVDSVEQRGLVERRRRPTDRRAYGLYLTDAGEELMKELGKVGRAHEEDITRGLSAEQRAALHEALTHIADGLGLTPEVHPGYRQLR
jgi:DNA-binding MarR family transcriptional regulator